MTSKMFLVSLMCILFSLHNVITINLRVDPLVLIDQGLIRGQKADDGDYSTFLGIPYAQVNLDEPFGPSYPHPGFGDDVFNANDGSIICPQLNVWSTTGNVDGTLDCLKLNIFVPYTASTRNPLPVLVWIHGGRFEVGGIVDSHGVNNLVKHGIVVVTINYRLGPYGFMCLNSPRVPGNQGLKDQYEALRWIRNNIAAFGGNPYNVTIWGESAGSCSVLLHLYSKKDKLFNKVIAASGTPQNEGMFVNRDENAALKLAENLGLVTTDTDEALNFLTNTSPDLVIAAYNNIGLNMRPCKERSFSDVDNFIDSDPYSLSNPTKIRNTPILIGHTSKEHLEIEDVYTDDPFYNKMKNNFDLDEEALLEAANIVRHFYIGDTHLTEDIDSELGDFDSDFVYNHSVQRTITSLLNENANPIYEYMFSYVRDPNRAGASHAEELSYLFSYNELFITDEDRTEEDQLITDRITRLWANFVIYGNPTPQATDLLPVQLTPVNNNTRPYLVIDTDLRVENRVYSDRMAFWDLFHSIYSQYNKLRD